MLRWMTKDLGDNGAFPARGTLDPSAEPLGQKGEASFAVACRACAEE